MSDDLVAANGGPATGWSAVLDVLQAADAPMLLLSEGLIELGCNAACRQAYGQPRPADQAATESLQRVLATGAADLNLEMAVCGPAGPSRVSARASRIRINDLAHPALLLAFEDPELDAARREAATAGLAAREMRHRWLNHLAILSALLRSDARQSQNADAQDVLEHARRRVLTLAEAERTLLDARLGAVIDAGPFLDGLCGQFGAALADPARPIALRVSAASCELPSGTAVVLGLILSELITNALKHAFVGRDLGGIHVTFGPEAEGWRLRVKDDGVGPGHAAPGAGGAILTGLCAQIGARIEQTSAARGCDFHVTGPRCDKI